MSPFVGFLVACGFWTVVLGAIVVLIAYLDHRDEIRHQREDAERRRTTWLG